jgi:ribonucleoside-diphosphate reductase alpha chain
MQVEEKMGLTYNALRILEKRYLLKDEYGNPIETPEEMFRRVAKAVAAGEEDEPEKCEEEFYQMMSRLEFLPNSPTLMNAGTENGQLAACFILPVPDSIDGIFTAVKQMALIHQTGGGTGFTFSRLRPRDDLVRYKGLVASGPLSFMRVFDEATDVVKQGGRRRGANMGILRMDHPDILDFIKAKEDENFLNNFNISIAVTDEFMETIKNRGYYYLINPRTGQKVNKRLWAPKVFDLMAHMAWKTGDPGIVFIDEINRHNPTPQTGGIESTNPCGEQPLLPFESCNLGSINLSKVVKEGQIDWGKLKSLVRKGVHFLDNVINVTKFPLPEIAHITLANRKVGLGIMGFAELLIQLGIRYDTPQALDISESIMKVINEEAKKRSIELAQTRGPFPNFKGSLWNRLGHPPMRNATTTTIAPTGTISLIAGTTSGIEPLFAIALVRHIMEGTELLEINTLFEEIAREKGFYRLELMEKIAQEGSMENIGEIPGEVKQLFVTAFDIFPEWHVRIQAAFQKYTDNAVSKTINLPSQATPDDVKKAFLLAYDLKCKGVTVYRYGSKKVQVLYVGTGGQSKQKRKSSKNPPLFEGKDSRLRVDSEFAGDCKICLV